MITIASTTDSVEAVEAALNIKPKAAETTPDPATTEKPAEAKTDPPAEVKPAATEEEKAKEASEAGKALAARKSKLQDRIDTLVREKHTSARERDEARRELEKLRKDLEARGGKVEAAPAAKPDVTEPAKAPVTERPKQGDTEDYESYLERLADWKAEQKVNAALEARDKAAAEKAAAEQKAADEKRAEAAKEEAIKQRQARLDQAKAKHADFDTVLAAASGFKYHNMMAVHVGESELGGELLYYLASNKEECEKIAELCESNPAAAMVSLGKLEARIEAASVLGDGSDDDEQTTVVSTPTVPPAIAARPTSNAPVMVSRVSGGGGPQGNKSLYDKDLSYAEHKALMAQRERAKYGR